jgi:hypothetical protein
MKNKKRSVQEPICIAENMNDSTWSLHKLYPDTLFSFMTAEEK